MAKRKRGGLKSESTDSFLDLLFNVIGILVLIVAFAAIASVTTTQVRGISLAAKSGTAAKQQINIVCNGGRAIYADYNDQDGLQEYFAMRRENRRYFLTPKQGWPSWWQAEQIVKPDGPLEKVFQQYPSSQYDISLLIFQDSFTIASRIETLGRNQGYAFRHVFFKTGEALEFSRQKITVN